MRAQKAFFAERDTYHDSTAPWPDFTLRPSGDQGRDPVIQGGYTVATTSVE